MNMARLHLLVNHVPVIAVPIGTLLLVGGIFRGSRECQKAALWLLVLAGLSAGAAFLTGDPAASALARLAPEANLAAIGAHDEAAGMALAGSLAVAATAFPGLFAFRRSRKGAPVAYKAVVLALCIIACGLLARTAYFGGLIRHTETTVLVVPAEDGARH